MSFCDCKSISLCFVIEIQSSITRNLLLPQHSVCTCTYVCARLAASCTEDVQRETDFTQQQQFMALQLSARKVGVDVGLRWEVVPGSLAVAAEGRCVSRRFWASPVAAAWRLVLPASRKQRQLVLSHWRPTSFLEGGGCLSGRLDVCRRGNGCAGDGRGEEEKQNAATRMLREAVPPLSRPHNRKRCFHNTVPLSTPRLHALTTGQAGIPDSSLAVALWKWSLLEVFKQSCLFYVDNKNMNTWKWSN